MESIPTPPEGTVVCLFCKGTIALPEGEGGKYKDHLRREHSVYYNNEWVFQQTLASQWPGLAVLKGIEVPSKQSCDKGKQTEKKKRKELFIVSKRRDDGGETTEEDAGKLEQQIPTKRSSSDINKLNTHPEKRLKIGDSVLTEDKTVASETEVETVVNDTDIEEKVPLDINDTVVKPFSLDIKRMDASRVNDEFRGKIFGNNYAFSCKTRCKMCHKLCNYRAFHLHTETAHQMSFKTYKTQFGEKIIKREVTVYHQCKICGEDLLLDKVEVKQHLVQHSTKIASYNDQYMEYSGRKLDSLRPESQLENRDEGESEGDWASHGEPSDKASVDKNIPPEGGDSHKESEGEEAPAESGADWEGCGGASDQENVSKETPTEGATTSDNESEGKEELADISAGPAWYDDDDNDAYCPDVESDGGYYPDHDSAAVKLMIVPGNVRDGRRLRDSRGSGDEIKTDDLINELLSEDGFAGRSNDIEVPSTRKKKRLNSESRDRDMESSDSTGSFGKAGETSAGEKRRPKRIKCDTIDSTYDTNKSNIQEKEESVSDSKSKHARKTKLRSLRELRRQDRYNRIASESSDTESPIRSRGVKSKSVEQDNVPDNVKETKTGVDSNDKRRSPRKSIKEETKQEIKPDVVDSLLVQNKTHIKPKSGPSFRNGKFFSDNYEDCCKVRCKICMRILGIPQLRGHTRDDHSMKLSIYKEKFGSEYDFVNEVYHNCKLCGFELLLCSDTLATHAKSHKLTLKEYTDKHIIKSRDKDEEKRSKSFNRSEGIVDNETFMGRIAKEALTSSIKSKDVLPRLKERKRKYITEEKPKSKNIFRPSTSKDSPRKDQRSDKPKVIKISKKSPEASKDPDEECSEEDTSDSTLPEENHTSNHWYDGNSFECKKCKFTAMSRSKFKAHAKKAHGSTMVKFKGNYSQTKNMYECKFCAEEVNHEKLDIKIHIDNHFLTLDKYAMLYERDYLEKQKIQKTKTEAVQDEVNTPGPGAEEEIIFPPLQMDNIDLVEGGSWMSFSVNNPLLKEETFSDNNPLLENLLDEHNLPREESELDENDCDNRDPLGSPLSQLDQIPINQLVSAEADMVSDNSRPVSPASDEDDDGSAPTRAIQFSSAVSVPQLPEPAGEGEESTIHSQDQEHIETNSEENSSKSPPLLKLVNETVSEEESIDFSQFTKNVVTTDTNEEIARPRTPTPTEMESAPKLSSEEESLYLCPFEGCKFQTDLEGMRSGPAARHGMEVHNTQPWEIKKHGLKFKRVSVEKHLETLFADSDTGI